MQTRLFSKTFCLAAGLLSLGSTAQATLTFSIADPIGNPLSVSLLPGETFTFTLSVVSTAESTYGLSFRLEATDGSGFFRITGRDTADTAFGELNTSNPIALETASGLLDPSNNADLGGTTTTEAPNGTGTHKVAAFTFEALPGTPAGNYTIRTSSDAIATNGDFNDVPLPQASYSVTVVPEPGSAVLGALGFGLLAGYTRRRRS